MPYVKPGDPLDIPADDYNGFIDAKVDNELRKLGGPSANSAFYIPPGAVMLKNSSGGNLVAGRVLEIGDSLLTTFDRRYPWFNGTTPALATAPGTKGIAVTLLAMASNDIWWCMASGICLARVNINHEQQTRADADTSSTLLQSKWHGRAEILKKESSGTGEKNCWIRLGEMFRGPILCKATSGITAGSSASCAVYWAGAAASPSSTITVHLKDMDGGNNLASDAFLWAWWKPDDNRYETGNAEC